MSGLARIDLPGGIMLAWVSPEWVKFILPVDTRKKRALCWLVQSGLMRPFQKRFDGTLTFGDLTVRLDDILPNLALGDETLTPAAVFGNAKRDPARIYVWLHSGDEWYFLKLGGPADKAAFRNEASVCADLAASPEFRIPRPLGFDASSGVVCLLLEGLSPDELSRRQKLEPRDMLSLMAASGTARKGPFGGVVHGDLASNNVFRLGAETIVVDWEFASASGPDFCDAVCLAVALNSFNSNSPSGLSKELNEGFGINVTSAEVAACLDFTKKRAAKYTQLEAIARS